MLIRNIIRKCSDICNLGIPDEYFDDTKVISQDREVIRLVDCCNAVADELYNRYVVNRYKVKIRSQDCFINLADYNYRQVISVCNARGPVRFYMTDRDGVDVDDDGEYTVTLVMRRDPSVLNDYLELPKFGITERIFIYGVLEEYYRVIGDDYSSKMWGDLYDDALQALSLQQSRVSMPKRRWL